uniref:tRNA (guanosine(18)-2'-O)-methyltransferase TARBP1 n=1 Tax=Sphenodon punctatus TaxID=8508 RepID=A0A8D0H7W7_SPHPU
MELVLADTLLSQSRDPGALLRGVCGGGGGGEPQLSAERVEALCFLLQRLPGDHGSGQAGAEGLEQAAWEVALGRCLPLLRGAGASPERLRLVRSASGALRHCVRLGGPRLAARVAEEALAELGAAPGTEAAVEALAAVATWLEEPALLERAVGAALALGDEEEEVVALGAGRLLLPALGRNRAALGLVWEGLGLGQDAAAAATPQRAGRTLLVLSALSDALFPVAAAQEDAAGGEAEQALDARLSRGFWKVVQEGLTDGDGLCRKRARYLLKRAVDVSDKLRADWKCSQDNGNGPNLFWWSVEKNEELLKFWENYILIMETLEGNQIHVIKPVLPKINSLYEYALSEKKGSWLFHPSWHMCIYKRMFESENKTLTREGVIHFLEICETKCLPISSGFSEFIIGPLMDALSESSLYSRSPGQVIGTCPPLGTKLQRFLATYLAFLPEEEKGSFLLKFIQKMSSRHWCAVPILFLSMALAYIPPCKALGTEGLLALRGVLQCTMITHQILLRGAAQCYLLQTAMHLTDVEKISLSDISGFLMSLRPEESLSRGTVLWVEVCDWLCVNDSYFRKSINCDLVHQEKSSLCIYVQSLVEDYLKAPPSKRENCFMPDLFEAKLVATMVLLAADVEEMKNKLRSKCIYAYNGVLTFLWNSVMTAADSILEFIIRRLTSELNTISDLDRCNLYVTLLLELVNICVKTGWKPGPFLWSFISSLTNASVHNLQESNSEQEPKLGVQIQKVVSMASLRVVCDISDQKPELQLESLPAVDNLKSFITMAQLNQVLNKPCSVETNRYAKSIFCYSFSEELVSSQGWGKIVAHFVHDQWVCLHFILNHQNRIPLSEEKNPELLLPAIQRATRTLQSALEALTILPSDQVLPVFRCMKILVPKLLGSSESLCIEAFHLAWKIISSLSNTQLIFWPNLKAFVQFVFDPELLAVAASSKGQAYSKIREIIFQMIEMSTTRTGVFNAVLSYCCQSWIAPNPGNLSALENPFSNARDYSELIIEACVFGTIFRRDQRLIQEVHAFVENLGDECAVNVVTERDDHYVRVCAIKFLCVLDGSNTLHKMFIDDLANKLLDKDELVSKSRTRYYVNSLQHRVKNRLWQTLLILFPKLDQEFLNGNVDRILQAGFSNNQASIKYLIEWIIILILHKYPQFIQKFWDCFSYGEEQLKTSICTFLSVVSHFDIIIQNISEKKSVLKKALVVVLQWCFNHNFSVRLYALVALKKIWGMCKMLCGEEFEALNPVIESSLHQVENVHGTGNAKKNWQRIQEHFFFATFHPLKDYSLETIFYTLPRLSEIIEDEWILLCKFTRFTDIPLESTFQSYESRTELLDLKPSDWSQQDTGFNSVDSDNQREWTDVQKKIIPWKNSIPDLDLELVFQDRAAKLGKSNSSLIVVASLINKPTNLGGLCRTSEIFGASALVVGSLHCINDKQFQYLSVSAEQWLPLIEVKPSQLVDYLQQKKTEGYTIIGVEQTAKSSDLTEYCFPEKSLLLLGNEHEGIPANLIQHLDVCVEIPQQGVIRSLNVHVSGALLIWEYTRQQMIKEKGLK